MEVPYKMDLLEKRIQYSFNNKALLKQAITHSSYANEKILSRISDYERIEFLGDAVLELVSSEFIFQENPAMTEGNMTKFRASLVCEPALAYCAKDLELGNFIFLGKGEDATGGRNRDSIIADVMEAIIGAIYLDGGIEKAREFILTFILSDLENKKLFYDSKTILQEMVQKVGKGVLSYELISEQGPDHNKEFEVVVKIDNVVIGTGKGKTKKAAEQKAAFEAIMKQKK